MAFQGLLQALKEQGSGDCGDWMNLIASPGPGWEMTHQQVSLAQGLPGTGRLLSEKGGTVVQHRSRILITLFKQHLPDHEFTFSEERLYCS